MYTSIKRLFTMLLALVLCVSAIPLASLPASAATSSTVASKISANLPIVTYAMPLSGASRVYSYSSSSLSYKTTGYYIDTYSDQIVITKISSNGKAVYVTYPSSSARSGYRSRWFAADDILGIASVNVQTYTASAKSSTYRMRSSSTVTSYGSIARNDSCISLGSHSVSGKTYYPTIYPISSSRYNGVSGVKHKIALSVYCPSIKSSTSTSSLTAVQQRLKAIGTGKLTYNSNTVLILGKTFVGTRSNEQCKGYAKNVFYLCFGVTPGSTRAKPYNYLLNSTKGMTLIGSVTNMTSSNIKSLFQNAKPGDFVQIRRTHGGSHSAIVYSVSSTGVKFLEANLDGKNTIVGKTYTWAELCRANAAMSVYTATNYILK